jgi:hypothetical protein
MMQPKLNTGPARFAIALILLAGAFCAPCGQVFGDVPIEYLQDDVRISGQRVYYFQDNGENVSVVVGDFRLSVGERSVSGDNGVVWIRTTEQSLDLPGVGKHTMVVYVEGNVRVVDEGGSVTEDNLMLVKLHAQGRLTTSASVTDSPQQYRPLYRKALRVRAEEQRMQREWRSKVARAGMQRGSEPGLQLRPSAEKARQDVMAAPSPTPPALPVEEMAVDATSQPAAGQTPSAEAQPSRIDDEPELAAAVMFQAEGGIQSETDPDDPNRRIITVPGNIYLAQGTADSDDNFLEMQANSAVIFTRKGLPEDDPYEQVPYAPQLEGFGDDDERITGVYLESAGQSTGGVVITRGERRMRAQAAYYDFTTGKAVVLKPVFRTVQEQRNIPVIVRAEKARTLNEREIKFYNARVSTSEFHTPTYHLGAKRLVFRDETEYSSEGEQLSERGYSTSYEGGTWNMRGFPFLWSPRGETSFEEGHSPLRTARVGSFGEFGPGVETQWHLFRLLGVVPPEGFEAYANFNAYERGVEGSVDLEYQRREANREYSGYGIFDGVYDTEDKDQFGRNTEREVPNKWRGRALLRHKEFLPRDWQIQGELSLLSDRGFLRTFYSDEFYAGKPQENLIYAKKQRDNWAVTGLLKARLNWFLTQTESLPEAAGYLVGESLLHDMLTYHAEARLGAKRYRYISDARFPRGDGRMWYPENEGETIARFDTLHELSLPLQAKTAFGPLNIVPYVKGRLTFWSDSPNDSGWQPPSTAIAAYGDNNGAKVRPYGQAGVRANMHFWRVFPNVESRLWDLHQLRHIITPELVAFTSHSGGVAPHDVYPMDPEVEQHIMQNHGIRFGIHQRLQTKRGPAGARRTVDWMRLNVIGAVFAHKEPNLEGDGRFFFTNPEYSLQRNTIYGDFTWNISDATAFLADASFDLDDGELDRANAGFAVRRDPRLSYYLGMRYVNFPDAPATASVTDIDSLVGTFGLSYKINKKYTINLFEQYDFLYDDGTNLGSRLSLVRKFPRWYASITLMYDRRNDDDDLAVMLMIWPEGVPEFRLGSERFSLLGQSDKN